MKTSKHIWPIVFGVTGSLLSMNCGGSTDTNEGLPRVDGGAVESRNLSAPEIPIPHATRCNYGGWYGSAVKSAFTVTFWRNQLDAWQSNLGFVRQNISDLTITATRTPSYNLRIDVFGRDTNNAMAHTWSTDGGTTFAGSDDWGAAPSGWTFVGNPDAAGDLNSNVHLFTTAAWTSFPSFRYLFHRQMDIYGNLGAWENWGTTAGFVASGPGAASECTGQVDVFVLTGETPPQLAHAFSTSAGTWAWDSAWTVQPPAGTTLVGDPDIASWWDGRLDVWIIDSNGHMRQAFKDGGGSGFNDWGLPPSGRRFQPNPGAAAERFGAVRWTAVESDIYSNPVIWERFWDNGVDTGWINGGYFPDPNGTVDSSPDLAALRRRPKIMEPGHAWKPNGNIT